MTSINELTIACRKVARINLILRALDALPPQKASDQDKLLLEEYYEIRLAYWQGRRNTLQAITKTTPETINQMTVVGPVSTINH